MKKKILWGHWFYTIGLLIFVLLSFGLFILFVALGIIYPESYIFSQFGSWLVLVIFSFLATVFLVVGAGCFYIQFTVISERGIKIRAPFRTIRSLEWVEVREVRYERFYVSVQGGFTSGWYVFDDGIERKQCNGLVSKKSHITVPASKRVRKIIEEYWHGMIIEKEIK